MGDSATRTAELCVESLHPAGAQPQLDAVVGRLRRLVEAGSLDGFDVTVWGDRVGVSTAAAGTGTGESIRATVEACHRWARRHGRTFRPCFDVRTTSDAVTGEEYTVIDLPAMVLLERVDGAVDHAVPTTDGTGTETVSDRLAALEAGRPAHDAAEEPDGGSAADRPRERSGRPKRSGRSGGTERPEPPVELERELAGGGSR